MSKIGLVLSGGMAKGAFQIGVLKALNEIIPPDRISCISASSIGVLSGYAFLTGKLKQAESSWDSACDCDAKKFILSITKSGFLQDVILNMAGDGDEIVNDFYVSLLNASTWKLTYANLKSVPQEERARYLKASVAMPVCNQAVSINGHNMYDGAIIDNIPVYPLVSHALDYIICVHFDRQDYIFENEQLNQKIIPITFPDTKMISTSVWFNKNSIEHMRREGYLQAKQKFAYIFENGFSGEAVLERIVCLNQQQAAQKQFRITGDIIIRNINKVTQKFIKKDT
ncbi:MAG: patatin-like phospholipase family protein [Oscillospiraceae bacterium]|nr:patatin-like phospholipase family protein [Oscillospiraceae bacterium]